MKIERALEKDVSGLCDVFNKSRNSNSSFPKHKYALDDFTAEIEGEEVLCCRINGELIGFSSVWVEDTFLHHLYVLPQYQNRGIGKALIHECINRFGLPMSLKCLKSNTKSCCFYEGLGWRPNNEALGPEGPYILYVRDKNT